MEQSSRAEEYFGFDVFANMSEFGDDRSGMMSRACRFCPCTSDINLLSYCESIVYLDSRIANCAFDFGVPQQQLSGAQISSPPDAALFTRRGIEDCRDAPTALGNALTADEVWYEPDHS